MNNKKLFSKILLTGLAIALPTTSAILLTSLPAKNSSSAEISSAINSYEEDVSISGSPSFNFGSDSNSTSIDGWTRLGDGAATTMIIDTEKNYAGNSASTYYLSCSNPGDNASTKTDSSGNATHEHKILMINSALKMNEKSNLTSAGFRSSEITIDANSFYYFEVSMKTDTFDESASFGSIYLTENKDGKTTTLSAFENVISSGWHKYYFYLASGDEATKVTMDLWLGTQNKAESNGVAFFDEVYVKRYSSNLFYDTLKSPENSNGGDLNSLKERRKFVKLFEDKDNDLVPDNALPAGVDLSSHNLNFENTSSNLSGWQVSQNSANISQAKIVDLYAKEEFEQKGYSYPGTNLKYNNRHALMLSSDLSSSENEGYISVISKDITIKAHEYLRIDMSVKTDLKKGALYVKLNEGDKVVKDFPMLNDSYNYKDHNATNSGTTSTTGDKFTNGYQTITAYVEGHTLYDSSFNIELMLGKNDSKAVGYAIIDEITIKSVSESDVTSNSSAFKFSILPTKDEGTDVSLVKNYRFNYTSADKDLTYPLAPKDWTISEEDEESSAIGVINTYKDYYNQYNAFWSSPTNPAAISGAPSDENTSNNVLMLYSRTNKAVSIETSNSISLSNSNKYYTLSFNTKTYESSFVVEVINDEGIVLLKDTVSANGQWENYSAHLYLGESSQSVKIKFSIFTDQSNAEQRAFIDNVILSSCDESAYNNSTNKADLSNFLLNLNPDQDHEVGEKLTTHPAFDGQGNGDSEGGVIMGNGNTVAKDQNEEPITKNKDLPNNVLLIRVGENSNYTLTSKFKINVDGSDTAKKYYKLTFELLTNYLPDEDTLPKTDEDGNEISYSYGVSVGMSGFELVKNLRNNTGWKQYTIYFESEKSQEVNFVFSLISSHNNIYGTAYLTNIKWTEDVSEAEFTALDEDENLNKTVFKTMATVEEENNDSDSDDSTDTDTDSDQSQTNPNSDINWLLIPSIIMAVALVIAIVGAIIRKVMSKKKKKEVKETPYNRKETLDKDVIRIEAERTRDSEQKELSQKVETITKEIEDLDASHKEYIKEQREKTGGRITTEIEKQFKSYTNKRSKLSDKLKAAKDSLDATYTADYMIALERKITADAYKLQKMSRKEAKDKFKAQKAEEKKAGDVSKDVNADVAKKPSKKTSTEAKKKTASNKNSAKKEVKKKALTAKSKAKAESKDEQN